MKSSPSAKKIVIIDRDSALVKLMTQFLSGHGYDIVPCTEGREAVFLIVREQYVDLMIIDYDIPDIDFDVIKEIMSIVQRTIPVIITSNTTMVPAEEQKKYHFMLKPIDFNVLLKTISDIIGKSQ